MSSLEDRAPFLPGPPISRSWRARAKDFNRRPLLVKQLVFLAIFIILAFPLWRYTFRDTGAAPSGLSDSQQQHIQHPPAGFSQAPTRPVLAPATSHVVNPPATRPHVIPGDPLEHLQDSHDDGPAPDSDTLDDARPHSSPPALAISSQEPVVFALIMWSADSASEGAILLKSILMYNSGPIELHIICDDFAQEYLEKRLLLVRRPRHNVLVRFYRPSWQAMLDRIAREGAISTVHAAGTPGLMKLFIHEILPDTVKRAVFVDTDAFFISDPLLLWQQFNKFNSDTLVAMPTHPEMFAPQWFNANKICSCIMLLDLEKLREIRLMDSSTYRAAGLSAWSPPAFRALFGPPDPATGHFEEVALGDQSFWWAIISYQPERFQHLHFDFEVSSCLLDMYITGLGQDDATEADELGVQLHTWATPHQGEVIMPKLVHFNCLPGPRYFEWEGWDDRNNSLASRWAPAVKYHAGHKWLWLNHAQSNDTKITIETVLDVKFADELVAQNTAS